MGCGASAANPASKVYPAPEDPDPDPGPGSAPSPSEEVKVAAPGDQACSGSEGAEPQWNLSKWLGGLSLGQRAAGAIAKHISATSSAEGQLAFVKSLGEKGTHESVRSLLLDSGALDAIADEVLSATRELTKAAAATGEELNAKFAGEASFELSYGTLSDFFAGLEALLGPPNPKVMDTMQREHCDSADSRVDWCTGNYGITTTPLIEWWFVVDPLAGLEKLKLQEWPKETKNKEHGREPPTAESEAALKEKYQKINEQLEAKGEPNVREEEFIGCRLYTGPLFEKYNLACRGGALRKEKSNQAPFMRSQFEQKCKGNRYTTTVQAINSGVIKMSKLSEPVTVYRGMTGGKLPPSFWQGNPDKVRGGIEFAFMSTTTNREVAVQYSTGKVGTVFEMKTGMIDRGASLSDFSQYPHEKEILFPPLTGVEVLDTCVEGSSLVIKTRLSLNLTAPTIERVIAKRKVLMGELCGSFANELNSQLTDAGEGDLMGEANELFDGLLTLSPEEYNNDLRLSATFAQMLAVKKCMSQKLSLKQLQKEQDAGHPDTLVCMRSLAGVLSSLSRHKEALALLRQALNENSESGRPDDPESLALVHDFGALLSETGEYKEAAEMLSRSVDGRRKMLGDLHPATLESQLEKAQVLCYHVRLVEAMATATDSMEKSEKSLAASHEQRLLAMVRFGQVFVSVCRNKLQIDGWDKDAVGERAAEKLRFAVKLCALVLEPTHPITLEAQRNLGMTLAYHSGEAAEAVPLMRKVAEGREVMLGPKSPKTIEAFRDVALCLRMSGQGLEATEPLWQRIITSGLTTNAVLNSNRFLGEDLLKAGRYDEAERYGRVAMDGWMGKFGPEDVDTIASAKVVVGALEATGKHSEAAELRLKIKC